MFDMVGHITTTVCKAIIFEHSMVKLHAPRCANIIQENQTWEKCSKVWIKWKGFKINDWCCSTCIYYHPSAAWLTHKGYCCIFSAPFGSYQCVNYCLCSLHNILLLHANVFSLWIGKYRLMSGVWRYRNKTPEILSPVVCRSIFSCVRGFFLLWHQNLRIPIWRLV